MLGFPWQALGPPVIDTVGVMTNQSIVSGKASTMLREVSNVVAHDFTFSCADCSIFFCARKRAFFGPGPFVASARL